MNDEWRMTNDEWRMTNTRGCVYFFYHVWHVTASRFFDDLPIFRDGWIKLKCFFFFETDDSYLTQTTNERTKWRLLLLTTGRLPPVLLLFAATSSTPAMKRLARLLLRIGISTNLDFVANAIVGLTIKPTSWLPATRMKTTQRLYVTSVSRTSPKDTAMHIKTTPSPPYLPRSQDIKHKQKWGLRGDYIPFLLSNKIETYIHLIL